MTIPLPGDRSVSIILIINMIRMVIIKFVVNLIFQRIVTSDIQVMKTMVLVASIKKYSTKWMMLQKHMMKKWMARKLINGRMVSSNSKMKAVLMEGIL